MVEEGIGMSRISEATINGRTTKAMSKRRFVHERRLTYASTIERTRQEKSTFLLVKSLSLHNPNKLSKRRTESKILNVAVLGYLPY